MYCVWCLLSPRALLVLSLSLCGPSPHEPHRGGEKRDGGGRHCHCTGLPLRCWRCETKVGSLELRTASWGAVVRVCGRHHGSTSAMKSAKGTHSQLPAVHKEGGGVKLCKSAPRNYWSATSFTIMRYWNLSTTAWGGAIESHQVRGLESECAYKESIAFFVELPNFLC